MSQRRTYFQPFVFIYIPIRNPFVSVYFVKTTPLNFIPFLSVCLFVWFFFFCRSERQSRRNVESVCFFFSSKHIHPPGANISVKSKGAAHCGRFGTLGTKKHAIKDGAQKAVPKAWLVFLSFFKYISRLVGIIGGSNSKNCRRYRFKKF